MHFAHILPGTKATLRQSMSGRFSPLGLRGIAIQSIHCDLLVDLSERRLPRPSVFAFAVLLSLFDVSDDFDARAECRFRYLPAHQIHIHGESTPERESDTLANESGTIPAKDDPRSRNFQLGADRGQWSLTLRT